MNEIRWCTTCSGPVDVLSEDDAGYLGRCLVCHSWNLCEYVDLVDDDPV